MKKKTKSDINKWYKWCGEHGEKRNLEELLPTELDHLLGHLFVSVRKAEGTVYEPDTLSFQRSINRHLTTTSLTASPGTFSLHLHDRSLQQLGSG